MAAGVQQADIQIRLPDTSGRTIYQMCADAGVSSDTVRVAWNRTKMSGLVSRPFGQDIVPTSAEIKAVAPLRKMGQEHRGQKTSTQRGQAAKQARPAAGAKQVREEGAGGRIVEAVAPSPLPKAPGVPMPDSLAEWPMWCVMAAATAVTLQSMFSVTGNIFAGNDLASWTLTGILGSVPLILSWQNKVSLESRTLVFGLICFEAFCNTARVYAGLLNFDTPSVKGEPTDFLAMVMGMLGTEKGNTALVLAATIAAIIAAIFGLAFRALNKGK